MLDALKNAYAVFEQLNISVTGLIVIAILLALAFLFSIREAATWFFKVDDLKRDISRLREITTQMDGQIRSLQSLLGELRLNRAVTETAPAAPTASVSPIQAPSTPGLLSLPILTTPPAPAKPAPTLPLSTISMHAPVEAEKPPKSSSPFTITH